MKKTQKEKSLKRRGKRKKKEEEQEDKKMEIKNEIRTKKNLRVKGRKKRQGAISNWRK